MTGLFTTTNGRHGRRTLSRAVREGGWTGQRIAQMCDLIADGLTYGMAANELGTTRGAVEKQFARIRQAMGPQAS